MAGYDEALETLHQLNNDRATSPAAPKGMRQQARKASMDYGDATSQLQQWNPGGVADDAQKWYTGANVEGESSGWSTKFVKSYFSQWTDAVAKGEAKDYFSKDDAVGVVTWDHEGKGGRSFKFGDIVQDGKVVSNVYDESDQYTADLRMLPWLAGGGEQARLFEDPSAREQRVRQFVSATHEENNTNLEKALDAMEFSDEVKATQAKIQDGSWDEIIAGGGGAVGGALTWGTAGAVLGSVVPGIGTAVGATVLGTIGAGVGFVGGLLNKDEVAESVARAAEITKLANEENNRFSVLGTGLSQGSQVAMKFTMPLGNLARGTIDAALGEVGDGISERYEPPSMTVEEYHAGEEPKGVPMWAKAADWSSLVGDSLMQFASPFNRMVYTAQISGYVGGESLQLATTGEFFDPRRGGFDNIFFNDAGDVDMVSGAAGIMKLGIDAVQLAGYRGLARQSDSAALQAAGVQGEVRLAGHRFKLDDSGRAIEGGARKTTALLAPSEQIAWATASRQARLAALKDGRAVSTDDFYRAANNLAYGSNRLRTAMVNGFGEGYEELVQAILEPIAVEGDLDFGDMSSAFAFGVAGGLGMSLGATIRQPGSDARMMAQAYTMETFRRSGAEPDPKAFAAEWNSLTETEKRVRTARTPADIEMIRSANEVIARDHSTTMVASETDAAHALDARRMMFERELKSSSTNTDAYHVVSGLVDLGRVSETGELLGTTAPAEAVHASARTVGRLLEERLEGLAQQEQFLAQTLAGFEPGGDQAAEYQAALTIVSRARVFGEQFAADIAEYIEQITDATYTPEQRVRLVNEVNRLMRTVFERRAPLNPIEGLEISETELADAAAYFVSQLHEREPKLDAGSFHVVLPWISTELTMTDSDNMIQVNTDIIQALNADFDGDKLHGDHRLVLPWERFVQLRAGQNFGGSGRVIDQATRNFDEALASSVATGLAAPEGSVLRGEADGVIDAIEKAVTSRYGSLMSPAAMSRVTTAFREAMVAGSAEARSSLLNDLAVEAGEAINDLGRQSLRNEWLWVSKVVRANLNAYQTQFRKVRVMEEGEVAPSGLEVEEVDTPEGTNIRKTRASNVAQTLAEWMPGDTLFRKFQKIHFSWYNSSTIGAEEAARVDSFELTRFYEELARDITRPDIERTQAGDPVIGRVLVMLERLVNDALDDPNMELRNPAEAMTLLANVQVKDVEFGPEGLMVLENDLTLGQMLLRLALDADREENSRNFDRNQTLQSKHAKLRAMTIPNQNADQVNGERAFVEIVKAAQFGDSLGGRTGALSHHTTPEQWLRNFMALDDAGRQDLERFYTNVPEYLDRKGSTNIPYTLNEAKGGGITAYRSMIDSMLAVARAELTFDPSKGPQDALGGRVAKVDAGAREDFRELHTELRAALAEYRKISNRSTSTREGGAQLLQQMFTENPMQGRQILDLVPEAAANALYEFKNGELWVAPWLYEALAEENPERALFSYWSNLTLAKWNATLASGRDYATLSSRFERLMYELAREPGQLHMEMLIRQMKNMNSLDEFFFWLNTTPGFRGQQAPFLPFFDDVAEFDSDAAGGWVTIKPGTDLRQALTTAKMAATQMRKELGYQQLKQGSNKMILDGIVRAHNNDPQATELDRDNLARLSQAVETAKQLPRGFAPSAMLSLLRGMLNGFDAHSHDKGQTSTSYKEFGEFQALMDSFAFVPGLERVTEVLTAHNTSGIKGNLGDLAKNGGTAMDVNGQEITWAPLDLDQAIDLLGNSRTAPLAHALLTPTAMDVTDAGMSERLLMEPSLKELLDNTYYKDLFDTEAHNQLDTDTRYLSLLDMRARAEGDSFSAIEYAKNLAIAMTSALGRPSTLADRERITSDAVHQVASLMRMVGRVQASPKMNQAGVLEELRTLTTKSMRELAKSRRLPSFTDEDSGMVIETYVDGLLADLEAERLASLEALAETYTGEALDRQREVLDAQYSTNERRIRDMLSDDVLATQVTRFELSNDPQHKAAVQARIAEYVLSMTNFPVRVPTAGSAWTKLANQAESGTTYDLTDGEWDTLSRAAISVSLVDSMIRVASHSTVPILPQAPEALEDGGDPSLSDARFFKYFDPSFAWLATDILQESSPAARAAVWLHVRGDQPTGEQDFKELTRTLERTLLKQDQFGTWTPAMMAQLIETSMRMDSAGAPPGIAMAGEGPKRFATIGAATRRTGEVPPPELLTTVTFTGDLLAESASPLNLIPVQPAGSTEPTSMPVAQLENRFFAAIAVNGEALPLDQENLGFEWNGAKDANPYRYVSLERLRPILLRKAAQLGVPLSELQVEAQFFHPDSQPVGAWNNAFFEGMSHSLLPDGSDSLVAGFWSDNGGQIAKDTQWNLDAGKKGKRAIPTFRRPPAEALAEANDLWASGRDFAAMLRRKAEIASSYDDGSGAPGAAAFNYFYKTMKLHHLVVGFDEQGQPAAMTAEEVIAFQAANGRQAELPLQGAKLKVLSTEVLRSMLGDTSRQGARRFFEDETLINPDLVDRYEGIDSSMLERFARVDHRGVPHGLLADAVDPGRSTLANVGVQRVMRVRTQAPEALRNSLNERRVFLDKQAAAINAARQRYVRDAAPFRSSYAEVLGEAIASVKREQTTFNFSELNGGVIGARNTFESVYTQRLLETYHRLENTTGYERAWRITDQGRPDYVSGTLTVESLNEARDLEHHVSVSDLALLQLDTFQRPERTPDQEEERVASAIRYLVSTGAHVVLGSGNGSADLRHFASQMLKQQGYVPVEGSKHFFKPVTSQYQSQNTRAAERSLTETGRISPAKQAITFLTTDPIEIDENSAILNPESVKLRNRKLVNSLVPSSKFPHYNIPIEDNRNAGLYSRTLSHLREVLNPQNVEAREALLKQGKDDPARAMPLSEALDRAYQRITETSSLEIEVGTKIRQGDIIFFVHPDGKVYLYRHGMKLPKDQRHLDKLMEETGINVAVAPSETEGAASAYEGTIRAVEDRVSYGRRLLIEVPLQAYGDKVVLEGNGMKYVTVPKGDRFTKLPRLFHNGTSVDLLSDLASSDSKEALSGRVVGLRDAMTFFQFDFMPDLVQFFMPEANANDPEASILVYNILHRLSEQEELEIPLTSAATLSRMNVAISEVVGEFAAAEAAASDGKVPADWAQRISMEADPSTQIARAVITYLLTPGAHVDNVLRSGGFSHPQAASKSTWTRQVPGLFADLLDEGMGSALHAELIRRFDAQLLRDPKAGGFQLNPDWTVTMYLEDGSSLEGYLQFSEAYSTGDNPVLDGQAFDFGGRGSTSGHNAMAASLSVGGITSHEAMEKFEAYNRSFTADGDVVKPDSTSDDMWHMLTALPTKSDSGLAGWKRETPGETMRRVAARDEIGGLYQPLNTEGWTEQEQATYRAEAGKILGSLNLYGSQLQMVDTWVRQRLGRPFAVDDAGNDLSTIAARDALDELGVIRRNITKNMLPTQGGNIPLIDVNHLSAIYLANLNLETGWAPVVSDETGAAQATAWDAWVEVAFGSSWIMAEGENGIGPEPRFHEMYQLAVDGLMHSYQGATSNTRYLPVSADIMRQRLLMDPKTNKMLASISADTNIRTSDPVVHATHLAELDDIISGRRIYSGGRRGPDPQSAMGRQAARVEHWHFETGAPRQVNKKIRGVRAEGQAFIGYTTSTSSFFRSMMALRVANTLINLSLSVAAPFEVLYRRTLHQMSSVLTGDSIGATGRLQTRVLEAVQGTKLEAVAQVMGAEATFTSEQHARVGELITALASLPEFKSMVFGELMSKYPIEPGIGKIEKGLSKAAQFGARMQDPALGMPQRELARRYVEAAMRRVSRSPLDAIYSIETLLTELPRNPNWLKENDVEAHSQALATIANIRSMKPNVISLSFRGAVESLAANQQHTSLNAAGNLIKVMTAFQNFWANFGTTITGMQAPVEFMAFWLDGKPKKVTARIQAALKGVPYDAQNEEFFDLSEAMESMDLADAFIKGGVTHSALFTLGMLAGGLGLSGEDEEMKFRRRQSELQGVPLLYDPRDATSDFRNKDVIYLDWLPWGLDSLFKDPGNPEGPAMAQMNWIARTFLSPVLGFERFYHSGDFSEVIYGFKDAIGSHPIINQQMWQQASETAAYLQAQANDEADAGDMASAGKSLVTAVSVLESMLFENSMLNMLYSGLDEWDRDPYTLPLKDSDGDLQRDVVGLTRPNDTALQPFFNSETGQIEMGTLDRTSRSAEARVLTENRGTMAFIAAMFTGGLDDSDFWRYNMPVKTRSIEKPELTQDEAEAMVRAAAAYQMNQLGQPNVTPEEAMPAVRNALYQMADREGGFITDKQMWKATRQIAGQKGDAASAVLAGTDKVEWATEEARRLFRGLLKGSVTLDDPIVRKYGVPFEMREKIQEEWATELVEEGIRLGLDETQAKKRMQRFMQGPLNTAGASGMADILWDKRISYSNKLTYAQKNTTYVMGPDGRPWATGFRRESLLGAAGLHFLKNRILPEGDATRLDRRGNVVDQVAGLNTGLRALEPLDDTRYIPTDKEIGDAIVKAIEGAKNQTYPPFTPYPKKDGNGGWKNYGRGSGYSGGGGGGGGAYFTKMYTLPRQSVPYANSIPSINTTNPILRRSSIRRERVWSERGRLNQWQ